MKSQSDLFSVSGLYWQESSKGNRYLQGKINDYIYVKVFKNLIKKTESAPDYSLCLDFKDNSGKMLNVSGLWIQESSKGSQYLQGRVGGAYLKAFKNTTKRTDRDPDYNLRISLLLDEKELDAEGEL
jgi:hypothetical protein